MISKIHELNFPEYVTLSHADVQIDDMGEKTITAQVKMDGGVAPDFSYDWEIVFQGEKYIMPLRKPKGAKENTSLNATVDLTFQHWAVWQLKRFPFVTIQPIETGTYIADEEEASVWLNLGDFCDLFGQVLQYYYGDKITIDLNPNWEYDKTAILITISHTKIWNVLIDAFYDKYGVRWEIKPREDNDNTVSGGEHYVIRVGYPTTEVDHIFEYGFEGGLLKVERQVQSEDIRNMLKGRGGDTNIPFRYFKAKDENNPDFAPDPDWVDELKNIYFTNLMGATFRSYVQGWKAQHIADYPGYTAVGESNAYAPWAYRKGYTDTKFAPVEFVADEITISPTTEDNRVEILPNYSPYVKKYSSLDKYGPLPDTLDNNEDIYPTIQGTGFDIAVAVEQIESDEIKEDTTSDAEMVTLPQANGGMEIIQEGGGRRDIVMRSRERFAVPKGKYANLKVDNVVWIVRHWEYVRVNDPEAKHGLWDWVLTFIDKGNAEILDKKVIVEDAETGEEISASGVPEGTYFYVVKFTIHNNTDDEIRVNYSLSLPRMTVSSIPKKTWPNTFDIWVKDIWGSTKGSTETDEDYVGRVWKPVLGDREGDEAKVVFTSGSLAHEDYEFTIISPLSDAIHHDTSKSWTDEDGVTHASMWRIKLAKSDAEYEATGLYVPNTQKQGKAGDTFAFIGTEMTHIPYVTDAEKRLDDWKKDQLLEKRDIKPTFVVTTDRVRINDNGKEDALINSLRAGNVIRLADKRFITDTSTETLYIQSVKYTFHEPSSDDAALNPDVELTLGTEYAVGANPVTMMQGEISAIQKQIGSISNVAQIVRSVGDRVYLRKDAPDTALRRITFNEQSRHYGGAQFGQHFVAGADGVGALVDGDGNAELLSMLVRSMLSSPVFRNGLTGEGWRLWLEDGLSHLEIDDLTVRRVMHVFELIIERIRAVGGQIVVSAANGKIKVVEEVQTAVGEDGGMVDAYRIYFEDYNYFQPNDLMRCQTFTGDDIRGYWVRISQTAEKFVVVVKSEFEDGVAPREGDEVVLMGNKTNKLRQNLISISATEDGQPRIDVLNGVNDKNFTGCLRARLGNLDGITDDWFPADNQPHGDGLYADNAYLRGTFLLVTGDDVKTKFEIVEGKITSEIEGVRNEFTEGRGFLSNPMFSESLRHWSVASDTMFFLFGEKWIWANGNVLTKRNDGTSVTTDNGRKVALIKNSYLIQKEANFRSRPEVKTNDDGLKEPIPIYLSFMYKVRKSGVLAVGFNNTDDEGFVPFTEFGTSVKLEATDIYQQFTMSGLWSGNGDFTLAFTGEILVYMLVLTTDRVEALSYKYRTLFEQSDKLIRIAAENYDNDGKVLESSEIITTSKYNLLTSNYFDADGKLKNQAGLVTTTDFTEYQKEVGVELSALGSNFDNYVSIESFAGMFATAVEEDTNIVKSAQISAFVSKDKDGRLESGVIISGDQIDMAGKVNVNGKFIINTDGSIEATDGKFSGEITATSGSIGGFEIKDGEIGVLESEDGMSLQDTYIQFKNGQNKTMLTYGRAFAGQPVTNIIIDNKEVTSTTCVGVRFAITGNMYEQNYAFVGSGNGVLDGVVEGWKLNRVVFTTKNQFMETHVAYGKYVLASTDFSDSFLVLPHLKTMRRELGSSSDYAPLAVHLTIVVKYGTIRILGRQGSGNLNNLNYPYLRYLNGTQIYCHDLSDSDYCEILLTYSDGRYDAYTIGLER